MVSFEDHIILDVIDSWPDEILELIKGSEKHLRSFLNEERRIDLLGEQDILVRINRLKNSYSDIWNDTIDELELRLKKYFIVGIHCTKLLEHEIEDVKQNGLKPLSRSFAIERIKKAFAYGLISPELRYELINKEELDAENRKDRIFLFHCLSTLKWESGLKRLLGYWGGESMFAYVKNLGQLKDIGTSCIVFASIKISELDFYPQLSKRMVSIYLNDDYFPCDTDSVVRSDLKVLRVIGRNEKLFEDFTRMQSWDELDL